MRPATSLVAETTSHSTNMNHLQYDLSPSPRSSVFSEHLDQKPYPQAEPPHVQVLDHHLPPPAPTPSIPLLFSQLSRRNLFLLLLPASFSSVIAGGVAPFMTYVVGRCFAAFAAFPQSNPTQQDKSRLLHDVGFAALELVALALGAIILSSVTSCLWIWTGERNVMAVRKHVYRAISQKDLVWFDNKMGVESNAQGPVGAGGLMAIFSRETDDVRTATSLAAGHLLQYLTTSIACLILAFVHSWLLTFVILSAVPLLLAIQVISQALATPLLASERSASAAAATVIDRAIISIATVKAFNAEAFEHAAVSRILDALSVTSLRLNVVWGITGALSQFSMMAMFVQGFWFGSKLVREGTVSAGDVMTVFWACLIATTNLQMCIPQLIALSRGKFAMASLLTLAGDSAPPVWSDVPLTPSTSEHVPPSKPSRRIAMSKIKPSSCFGEFSLNNISFTYPTLDTPTLSDVSLYLPANEMTFIVGSSGSGKSTIAQLLLRLYLPSSGDICLDDRDVRFLDEAWMRSSVVGVGQGWGDIIMDGKSIAENVMLGVNGVTQAMVEDACRAALLHEFVIQLPDGYATVLGGNGLSLSGGQRQRLAIARAWLRNPPVLVLDEATSALDPTSRLLVFEALKIWRKNKTTIVITHDLSQITAGDFIYVMKQGRVVQQGFRCDLEKDCGTSSGYGFGEFRKMLDVQLGMGGCLPTKDMDNDALPLDVEVSDATAPPLKNDRSLKHQTLARPITFGTWMFDVVAELTSGITTTVSKDNNKQASQDPGAADAVKPRKPRPRTLQIQATPLPIHTVDCPRLSLQFTPMSPILSAYPLSPSLPITSAQDEDEMVDDKKTAIMHSGDLATRRRAARGPRRHHRHSSTLDIIVPPHAAIPVQENSGHELPLDPVPPSLWAAIRSAYPTIPYKPLLFIGLFVCMLSGAMTPLFSYLLSRLLFEASTGALNTSVINRYGGIVLGVAGLDGLLLGLKYLLMETCGQAWVTVLRKRCLSLVLRQDKTWFDKPPNSAVRLVQVLVRDGDEARNLVAIVMGQCVIVASMLAVGLVWALVRGWQLTFVGFAIAPVFVGVMGIQARLVAGCEARNKQAREEIARGYYDVVANVRGIRAMGFERVFKEKFDRATHEALTTGIRGAFVEGCTYGVASGLIYFSEALLFYVGAVLIAKGTYTYLQMVEVLNLVVFTVTIGSQLMSFTQRIAKSVQATTDFHHILQLADTTPSECSGISRPPITGHITLNNVDFSYPERPEVPVLKNINLSIAPGECVAIVGPSGSGKSTIASLLQRLYQPSSGSIELNGTNLCDVDIHYLRNHVSVVSQHPNLFDATISENIRYGSSEVSELDVRRAAKQANIHEFVMGLSKGYDTPIGENATLISSGQAQRLQIARALARPADILILDECTSALDPENQQAVLEAILRVARGGEGLPRTTVMITHKLQVMRMCDRIVVVDEGEVKEEGTFDGLLRGKGFFARLTRGGEWFDE